MTLRVRIVRSFRRGVFGAINWSGLCKGVLGTLSRTHETAESSPARNLKRRPSARTKTMTRKMGSLYDVLKRDSRRRVGATRDINQDHEV